MVSRVGVAYSPFMLMHICDWDEDHIEKPDRLLEAYTECMNRGLIAKCIRLSALAAANEDLLLFHTPDYLKFVLDTQALSKSRRRKVCKRYPDVYLSSGSYDCAAVAVGGTLECARSLMTKVCRYSMALIRPPGHHASSSEPAGCCWFNNVVLAAKKILRDHPFTRIAILDWDVHHGAATQRVFYNTNQVLFISVHRYEFGGFWPHLEESNFNFIGEDDGKGFNVNIPINEICCGDIEYVAIFSHLVIPILFEYRPDVILVSAGYDAAIGCPEGEMRVTPACFGQITRMMKFVAPMCLALEGGYHLRSLRESVAWTMTALIGDPLPCINTVKGELFRTTATAKRCIVKIIIAVADMLKNYWACCNEFMLRYNEGRLPECSFLNVPDMHCTDVPKLKQTLSIFESERIGISQHPRDSYYGSPKYNISQLFEDLLNDQQAKYDADLNRIKNMSCIFLDSNLPKTFRDAMRSHLQDIRTRLKVELTEESFETESRFVATESYRFQIYVGVLKGGEGLLMPIEPRRLLIVDIGMKDTTVHKSENCMYIRMDNEVLEIDGTRYALNFDLNKVVFLLFNIVFPRLYIEGPMGYHSFIKIDETSLFVPFFENCCLLLMNLVSMLHPGVTTVGIESIPSGSSFGNFLKRLILTSLGHPQVLVR